MKLTLNHAVVVRKSKSGYFALNVDTNTYYTICRFSYELACVLVNRPSTRDELLALYEDYNQEEWSELRIIDSLEALLKEGIFTSGS